jgi:hypothetical protein
MAAGEVGASWFETALPRLLTMRFELCASRRNGLSSGHLALRLGDVFRIELADQAVAAVALGRVEAGIGALDQRVGIVARLQSEPRLSILV